MKKGQTGTERVAFLTVKNEKKTNVIARTKMIKSLLQIAVKPL